MSSSWFVVKSDGGRVGPFTSQQLLTLAQNGQLLPDHRVWREGLAEPALARKIKGLFQSATAVASSPPERVETIQSLPTPSEDPASPRELQAHNSVRAERIQRGREFLGTQAGNLKRGLSTAVGEAKRLMADAITEANRSIDESEQITLRDKLVFGRSSKYCDWLIPHPTVAKRHFEIALNDTVITIRDLNTDTGTFVNGSRIPPKEVQTIASGDTVTAGPYVFQLNGISLRTVSKGQHAHLVCINLSKDVPSSDPRETLRILNQVTLEILPGEFVILLGPSGSGKSTLMNALSGRSLATSGDVLLNEQNLYANFDALKKRMAIVPQRDLLHDRLSLTSELSYTADLRLPPDIIGKEKTELVAMAINQVEMAEKASTPIANYSGGQIKRASLANELLSNPSLLFIDEATSGLDEHSDKEIMHMLRKLADAGKTVICITHNLGNVVECAHTIVVMANGGHLAFVGSPQESLQYFSISDLGQLYQRLKDRTGPEWTAAFSETRRYAEMADAAEKRSCLAGRPEIKREVVTPLQKVGVCIRHARTTARRNIALQLRDRRSLFVAAVQPVLVSFLIVVLFGSLKSGISQLPDASQVLFLLGISAFWFGCNNASKEIVKERTLFEKERNAGLDAVGYLMSKFLLLSLFTAAQSVFLLCIVTFGTRLEGSLIAYSIGLFVTGVCGVSLGLAISAMSSDTDVAATAVPLAIIPQVILTGAIKPVEGWSQWISAILAPCYWCFGMLWKSLTNSLKFSPAKPMWSQNSQLMSLLVICLFTTVFMSLAVSRLLGVKIAELAKRAELETWIRSVTDLNKSASARTKSVSPGASTAGRR
jgi:ABC-type multidrug transport system ATPase subunit